MEDNGRFTVPTLYDVKQGKIVSNESSEIIRMFYEEVSRFFFFVVFDLFLGYEFLEP